MANRKICPESLSPLLAQTSVAEVARAGGVSWYVAQRWFIEHGVPVPRPGRPTGGASSPILGDRVVVVEQVDKDEAYWRAHTERERPGLLEGYEVLGTTGAQLGRDFGITRQRVSQLMARAGAVRAENAVNIRRRALYADVIPHLGTASDVAVGEACGVSPKTVMCLRHAEGVPAYRAPDRYVEPEGDGSTECRWPGCDRPPKSRGLCASHRSRVSAVDLGNSRIRESYADDILLPTKKPGCTGRSGR